jgi:predicted ATPase
MINNISLSGFKSLKSLNINTAKLNVLVGGNATGKSSLIQSMLLLRQSIDADGEMRGLRLNGDLFNGGQLSDISHPDSGRILEFNFLEDTELSRFRLNYGPESAQARNIQWTESPKQLKGALFDLKNSLFTYLNAERLGPRVRYDLQRNNTHLIGQVGIHGEYAAQVLSPLHDPRDADTAELWQNLLQVLAPQSEGQGPSNKSLKELAQYILSFVIPGTTFSTLIHSAMDDSQIAYQQLNTKDIRPTHIGFGLSYILPIITAILLQKKESLFILENPEAHLHPSSQSRIGSILALSANKKISSQTFIETHSDHVVNGIRLAVKRGWVDSNDIKFHFFEKSPKEDATRYTSVNIDAQGSLSPWPKGFFDQIEDDLSQL